MRTNFRIGPNLAHLHRCLEQKGRQRSLDFPNGRSIVFGKGHGDAHAAAATSNDINTGIGQSQLTLHQIRDPHSGGVTA